jgi:flagellar motor protein MotB
MMLKKTQPRHDEPVRAIRLEHSPDDEIASDDQHGWAVSYSDLLMVLMSFFVLFFSFDPVEKSGEKKDVIREISTVLMKKTDTHASGVPSDTTQTDAGAGTGGSTAPVSAQETQVTPKERSVPLNAALEAAVKSLGSNYSMESERDFLTVHLKDNVYAPRSRAVTGDVRDSLESLLLELKPFAANIDIYFIGHADTMQFGSTRGLVNDNHILSALRATEALEFAISMGFPSNRLFSTGAAENMRSSRTLSIKVVPK